MVRGWGIARGGNFARAWGAKPCRDGEFEHTIFTKHRQLILTGSDVVQLKVL